MAHIHRHGDRWRAQVHRRGQRVTQVFDTKAEAGAWAARQEADILALRRGAWPRKTLSDAIRRYLAEVSALKASARQESLRLTALERDHPALAGRQLVDITTADIDAWVRSRQVSRSTVQRELNILSSLFRYCREVWRWMPDNPLTGLPRPGNNPPRTRRVLPSEVKAICRRLGYRSDAPPATRMQEVALAFLLALRTAMRAGEVLQLTRDVGAVAVVRHKQQHITGRPRHVPLTPRARRLAAKIPAGGWTITSATLDALFRKAKDSLLIDDLHFHDTRAEALTRFARRVDLLTLARISGHRDLRILNAYYRESAESIAGRLR